MGPELDSGLLVGNECRVVARGGPARGLVWNEQPDPVAGVRERIARVWVGVAVSVGGRPGYLKYAIVSVG